MLCLFQPISWPWFLNKKLREQNSLSILTDGLPDWCKTLSAWQATKNQVRVGALCTRLLMNEPRDNQTIQIKFHVWKDTEIFRNLTKSPLPTHPLVLPQCHQLPSPPPTVRPINGLSSNAGLIAVILLLNKCE